MKKLVHPQEVEVFYLLPAIRKELAINLKKSGMPQKQIARLLGVSEPSISHYFNEKRAAGIELSRDIKRAIEKKSGRIKTRQDSIKETQRIISAISNKKEICRVCHALNTTNIPRACAVCYE